MALPLRTPEYSQDVLLALLRVSNHLLRHKHLALGQPHRSNLTAAERPLAIHADQHAEKLIRCGGCYLRV